MREILFRGKRADNGEWVEGYLCKKYSPMMLPRDRDAIMYKTEYDVRMWKPDYMTAEVIPETIGQFTGLTDKNGKRIFEGDICLCDRNINDHIDKKTFIVEFESLRGWIGVSKDGWSEFDGSAWECAEVVGNVHDNPELLERKEQ